MARHEHLWARHLRFSSASHVRSFSAHSAVAQWSRFVRQAWRHAPVFSAHALLHASSLQPALQPSHVVTHVSSHVRHVPLHSPRQSSFFEKQGLYTHDCSNPSEHESAPCPRAPIGSTAASESCTVWARQSTASAATTAGSVHAAAPSGSAAGSLGPVEREASGAASTTRAASCGLAPLGTSLGAREHAVSPRTPPTSRPAKTTPIRGKPPMPRPYQQREPESLHREPSPDRGCARGNALAW